MLDRPHPGLTELIFAETSSAAPRRELAGLCARFAPLNQNGATVAPTGSRLYRGLAIRTRRDRIAAGRLPVGDTAGCQPALQDGSWAGSSFGDTLETY